MNGATGRHSATPDRSDLELFPADAQHQGRRHRQLLVLLVILLGLSAVAAVVAPAMAVPQLATRVLWTLLLVDGLCAALLVASALRLVAIRRRMKEPDLARPTAPLEFDAPLPTPNEGPRA